MSVTDAPAPRSESARLAAQIERLTQRHASAEREHSLLQSAHADALLESDEPFSNARTAALRRQVADKATEVDEIARALREAKLRHADAVVEEERRALAAQWHEALAVNDERAAAALEMAALCEKIAVAYEKLRDAHGRFYAAIPDKSKVDADALMLRFDLIADAINHDLVHTGCSFAGKPSPFGGVPSFAARARDAADYFKSVCAKAIG